MVFPKSFSSETIHWQRGDETKPNPFFILVLNNIALERPKGSGNFVDDFSQGNPNSRKEFTDCAEYIFMNILGKIANQKEALLSDSPFVSKIRLWSVYVYGLVANAATSLVAEDGTPGSTIIEPRRSQVPVMLKYIGLDPDIVFLVTRSPTHDRASAYGATDDDARGGVLAHYDGQVLYHRYFHLVPGMATIHTAKSATDNAMTAAHEFGHAFSSYTNGFVTDLYVDGGSAFNRKAGRPIPTNFATYNGRVFLSDQNRDSLGYPANWQSYHSELVDQNSPAVMDNFWYANGGPLNSVHDKLTKAYILDRVMAKTSR